MTDHSASSAFFGSYRPWGHVRRRNLMARVFHVAVMAVLGVAVIAGLVLLAIFAASLAVVAMVALALVGAYAALTRKPAHVRVQVREQTSGKGVYIARKQGSTWTVY